jgi:hypothetical protein
VAVTLEITDEKETDGRRPPVSEVPDTATWFAWSPASRPDLPRENRSPLHANRDWLRVVVPTPDEGGDHGEA